MPSSLYPVGFASKPRALTMARMSRACYGGLSFLLTLTWLADIWHRSKVAQVNLSDRVAIMLLNCCPWLFPPGMKVIRGPLPWY